LIDLPPPILVDRRRDPGDDKYTWVPFEPSDQFTSAWWDDPPYLDDDPWFVQALLDGEDVARVNLDPEVHIDHYAGVPDLGGSGLEIAFFEVSAAHQRRGIGTAVIRSLVAEHPDRRFVAFSEEADEFWVSLGWERFLNATDPDHYRPLFIQPGPRPASAD
jgi:GNAT superfamily N-acetyltransferase